MQLVKSLPIPKSGQHNNDWYEDFSQTGAKTTGLVGGLQSSIIRSSDGIKLEPSLTSVSVALPTRYANSITAFEAEWLWRGYGTPSTSTEAGMAFHYTDTNNRMYVTRTGSNNAIRIVKVVNGVYTVLVTVSNITFTDWIRTGLRVLGPNIELFNNGILIAAITEHAHKTMGGIREVYVYNPSNNIARSECKYIAVRSLGYNPYLVQDSFNRANAAVGVADSGQTWVQKTGTMNIVSEKVTNITNNTRYDIESLVADNYEIGARFRFLTSAGTDRRAILQLRCLVTGADNSLEVTLSRSGQVVDISTRTAGVLTTIGSTAYTFADNTDYWLKVEVAGQTIKVYISLDGITYSHVVTATSALYTTQTGVGLRLNDSATFVETITADNFYVKRLS